MKRAPIWVRLAKPKIRSKFPESQWSVTRNISTFCSKRVTLYVKAKLDSIDFYKEISYSFLYYSFLVIISLCLLHSGKCHNLQYILSKKCRLYTRVNSIQPCCSVMCQIFCSFVFSYERGNTHTTAATEYILTITESACGYISLTFQSWILQNCCQKRVKQYLMRNDTVPYDEIRHNYNSNKIIS